MDKVKLFLAQKRRVDTFSTVSTTLANNKIKSNHTMKIENMTKEDLKAADTAAMVLLHTAHLAWVDGGCIRDTANPLKQARDAAYASLTAIRKQLAAMPLTGDALLRHEQGIEANKSQLAASQRLAALDARTSGVAKTTAQYDAEYDAANRA